MFQKYLNRKLYNNFVSDIINHKYTIKQIRTKLKSLPNDVVEKIGKKIIYSDCNNYVGKISELYYFNNLDRWQKEIFIMEKLYRLFA